jgi:hypothetical protein
MKMRCLVAFAVLMMVASAYLVRTVHAQPKPTEASRPADYQAVFLNNGQVYFGKMGDPNGQFVSLTDIYYLKTEKALQQGASNEGPSISLVKLGNELHGPLDEMHINRDQILFWENMKSDSKVVQAIAQYRANGGH